jgi:glutathione S-transferase
MTRRHELVTIAFSHYCEKARWALDRFAVPYRESAYMPVLHFPAVMRAAGWRGRADKVSTRFSTPLLRTVGGDVLTDSAEIVAWVDARYAKGTLYPSAEAKETEHELGENLGPHARRLVYYHVLPERHLLRDMAGWNVGRGQAFLFRALQPVASRVIENALRVTAKGAARSETCVREIADGIAKRIADGRPYLLGDSFSAADLTFASLFAPMIAPPQYGAKLPPFEALPDTVRPLIAELREHPAGRFATRLYEEERRRTVS